MHGCKVLLSEAATLIHDLCQHLMVRGGHMAQSITTCLQKQLFALLNQFISLLLTSSTMSTSSPAFIYMLASIAVASMAAAAAVV